jgi:hypothetical protein
MMASSDGYFAQSGDGYFVDLPAMRQVVSNVNGLLSTGTSTVGDLGSTMLSGSAFGAIGAGVASTNDSLQSQQSSALTKLLGQMSQVNTNMSRAAARYAAADQQVARSYGGNPRTPLATRGAPTSDQRGPWGRGGSYPVAGENGDYLQLTPRDKNVPSVMIPNTVGAKGFEVGPAYDILHKEHTYKAELPTDIPFDQNSGLVGDAIAKHPVPQFPWSPPEQPASDTGSVNDAIHHDYVKSFTVSSPDPGKYTDITVNYTVSGEHRLEEGYVIRYGEKQPDGTTTLISYGEGNAWLQHPLSPAHLLDSPVWNANQRTIRENVKQQTPSP